jgi:hypothetical protein
MRREPRIVGGGCCSRGADCVGHDRRRWPTPRATYFNKIFWTEDVRQFGRRVVDAAAARAPGRLEERGRFIAGAIARAPDDFAHDVVCQAK